MSTKITKQKISKPLLGLEDIGLLTVVRRAAVKGTFMETAESISKRVDCHPRTILRYFRKLASLKLLIEVEPRNQDAHGFWIPASYGLPRKDIDKIILATKDAVGSDSLATKDAVGQPESATALHDLSLGLALDSKGSEVKTSPPPATIVVLEALQGSISPIDTNCIQGQQNSRTPALVGKPKVKRDAAGRLVLEEGL